MCLPVCPCMCVWVYAFVCMLLYVCVWVRITLAAHSFMGCIADGFWATAEMSSEWEVWLHLHMIRAHKLTHTTEHVQCAPVVKRLWFSSVVCACVCVWERESESMVFTYKTNSFPPCLFIKSMKIDIKHKHSNWHCFQVDSSMLHRWTFLSYLFCSFSFNG